MGRLAHLEFMKVRDTPGSLSGKGGSESLARNHRAMRPIESALLLMLAVDFVKSTESRLAPASWSASAFAKIRPMLLASGFPPAGHATYPPHAALSSLGTWAMVFLGEPAAPRQMPSSGRRPWQLAPRRHFAAVSGAALGLPGRTPGRATEEAAAQQRVVPFRVQTRVRQGSPTGAKIGVGHTTLVP